MKKVYFIFAAIFAVMLLAGPAAAKTPVKAKFYDFREQLIDGEIKKPTTLYTNARQQVKFGRLLRLKKSFLPRLLNTSKERVFK
tara:strand:+ start:1050 stop:1301 length:252 start_codon:yes stop_codon:yes gene_type:complete